MRIFFVTNSFPNRNNPSEAVFIKNIAEAVAMYDAVTLFYAEETNSLTGLPDYESKTENNVAVRIAYYSPLGSSFKVLNLLTSSFKRIYYLHRLIKNEFKSNRPVLFHFNIISPSVLLMLYYRFFYRIRFVYSEHWDIPLRVKLGLQKNWLPWRIGMKLSSLFAERTIVCSAAMKGAFAKYHLVSNAEIIPNVVDVKIEVNQVPVQKEDKKIILHVSSLDTNQKNVRGIIEAISEVSSERSDFELHILGKGKELQSLKELAASKNLLDTVVFFHGYVSEEEKIQWLQQCAFHIIFSNFEGHSVVTAEAICYGKPVIATRCGGPEDFVNQTNGLLIEPRDIIALGEGIKYMLDNYNRYEPSVLQNYGTKMYSPATIGLKHHKLYNAVLGKKPE